MKTLLTSFVGMLAAASLSFAQTTVSETTTTSAPLEATGTVTTIDPSGQLIVNSSTGSPVTYSYSKTTTMVDEMGNPVSVDVIKSGVPVTVYYSGDGRTVSKVIVKKPAAVVPATSTTTEQTTTTTTTP